MNERTLHALEYDKIIEQLKAEAATSLGVEKIESLLPKTNISDVKTMQLETDEARQLIRLNQTLSLGGIFDIRPSIERSKIGGMLDIEQCLNVATTIYGGRQTKHFIEQQEERLYHLEKYTKNISSLRELEQQICRCIDEDGNVLDDATRTLRSLRSQISAKENKVRHQLNHYIRTKSRYLSESIITIRNNRYVLPVKQDYQHVIGGIVHDQSASGQTVFMEPRGVVEHNNELRHLYIEEEQEIEKILRTLSASIAQYAVELEQNIEALAMLDFINARAKLGEQMKAVKPTLNNDGIVNMKQARHPLISKEKVVANDIEIGKDFTTIVITGPNTGGKTVTLKLIGLCTLMAQSGLQIPALDGCELAVFERVFADIGDEQSIEQNLSTFSAHMHNIVDIVKQVNERTLVLFDELGAGTDPQEGAALAMSILDEVVRRDARVVATTHYPELKAYAYNREQVINASVEFNIETLQPTYRLLIGVPGRSNAFEISERLGLNKDIINEAKAHIGIDSSSVETMIGSLEQSTREADEAYETAIKILQQSEQLYEDLNREWNNFLNNRNLLYKEAEKKAEQSLEKARQRAEEIVDKFREKQTFKEHEWIETRKQLEQSELQLTDQSSHNLTQADQSTDELVEGDDVKLLTINQRGTVIERINDDEFIVQVGMMRVNVNRKDLQIIKTNSKEQPVSIPTVRRSFQHVSTELDLRGERYDAALQRLEKYIDNVVLSGYSRVSIIHGKGTGALRKGVQTFVANHPNVASFREGKPNEGGSGITILTIQ